MDILSIILAGLMYPGLITALALGLLYRLLLTGAAPRVRPGAALGSREGLAALAGILSAAAGLAALPWPFHPAGAPRAWLWAWAGLELAFLLPLVPALASGVPKVARAAIRRAQIGVFGRTLLWAAMATGLTTHASWGLNALPAHLLALVATVIAFPIAIGWGPFDDEVSVTGAGVQAGLPPELRQIDDLARDVASGALLAAALLATLPTGVGPAWLATIMIVAGFTAATVAMRRLSGRLPRLSLPAILRLGWAYAAPLAAAAAVALIIAGRLA
ncbi:hypothetical protein EKD04_021175 [Chloroflexales bacterium ZM16-3]|nr:hypothetical protein [Chloroflexales bacterium ZM16-3]